MRMAAIYARVSSEQQREENTIASQTAALIEFAKNHDLEVPKDWVFEDEGFYEKVIKVKADVAALLIFLRHRGNLRRGMESCQGRRFLAFISTLDSSPCHFIIELGTKRNAVQLSFVP